MIADRTYRAASFLAARVKNRLRLAASTDHKAPRVLAHRAFRLRGQEQTVSDGSSPFVPVRPLHRKPPVENISLRQRQLCLSDARFNSQFSHVIIAIYACGMTPTSAQFALRTCVCKACIAGGSLIQLLICSRQSAC